MSTARATISLPTALMEDLKAEARRRKMSLSALIAERASQARPRPSWIGSGHADPDLSLKIEEIMRRNFGDSEQFATRGR